MMLTRGRLILNVRSWKSNTHKVIASCATGLSMSFSMLISQGARASAEVQCTCLSGARCFLER